MVREYERNRVVVKKILKRWEINGVLKGYWCEVVGDPTVYAVK
jgi:hypothetical protein